MGQSQPKNAATVCTTNNTIQNLSPSSEIPHTDLITKLGNPKMVPNYYFDQFIKASDQESVDKSEVFNFENCSVFEKELPDELFISILSYLNTTEIFKLTRVCKNFKNFWIEHRALWIDRSFEDDIYMYFKPILQTPMKTIIYYHTYFLPMIKNITKQEINTSPISKLVLLGKDQCGKSTFLKKILNPDQPINSIYTQTIGVEFAVQSYRCNNMNVKLQFWDCSGSERYRSITNAYLRGARTLMYCFDLNNEESFEYIKTMIEKPLRVDKNSDLKHENLNIIIVGLKRDLVRVVPMEMIERYLNELVVVIEGGIELKDLKIQYFELSSKDDSNEILSFPLLYSLLMVEDIIITESNQKVIPQPPAMAH